MKLKDFKVPAQKFKFKRVFVTTAGKNVGILHFELRRPIPHVKGSLENSDGQRIDAYNVKHINITEKSAEEADNLMRLFRKCRTLVVTRPFQLDVSRKGTVWVVQTQFRQGSKTLINKS